MQHDAGDDTQGANGVTAPTEGFLARSGSKRLLMVSHALSAAITMTSLSV